MYYKHTHMWTRMRGFRHQMVPARWISRASKDFKYYVHSHKTYILRAFVFALCVYVCVLRLRYLSTRVVVPGNVIRDLLPFRVKSMCCCYVFLKCIGFRFVTFEIHKRNMKLNNRKALFLVVCRNFSTIFVVQIYTIFEKCVYKNEILVSGMLRFRILCIVQN